MSNKKREYCVPWKKAFQLNLRAFMLIYKSYPQMISSRVICVMWGALTPYVGIYLSALVIDELAGSRNVEKLKLLVIAVLTSAAAIGLISALLNKWRDTQCSCMYHKIEQIFSKKLFDMDFVSVDDAKTHDILSKIRQCQNSGGWGLYRVIGAYESFISSLFTILGGIAVTLSLFISKVPSEAGKYTALNNPWLIVVIIAFMLALIYISPALTNKAGSYWAILNEDINFGNRLFNFVSAVSRDRDFADDVRIYRQHSLCKDFYNDKYCSVGSRGRMAKKCFGPVGLYTAAGVAMSVMFSGIAYIFVCLKAWAGAFGIGAVTMYISSISEVSGGISSLIFNVGDMRNNAIFLERVFEFLDIPNTMYQGSLTVEKRRDREYDIEFKNVSFKYPGSESYALRNVNLKFKVGNRLAIVGMNGSGKTTFVKLLCRLYDPTEGEILLNGINIKKYNYLEYMNVFSIVFQDFKLFALKIGENIATRSVYDREQVKDCLIRAGLGERLETLPDGLDTYNKKVINNNGVELSGGELQKLAIARALYKDAPFIILDEPTAALDPMAEAEIYEKFADIAGDKTTICISHRLSSCKMCDEIAVFHEGRIVQYGTHDSLVSDESGKYYELWNAQSQYYHS